MDNTNAQVSHLQEIADTHHAGVGYVYGGSCAECVLGRSAVTPIGIAATQTRR